MMMKRTVILKLQPSKTQEKALFELADFGAKVWNEVNYLRRQQFFNHEPVDFNKSEKSFTRSTSVKLGQQQFNKFAERTVELGGTSSRKLE